MLVLIGEAKTRRVGSSPPPPRANAPGPTVILGDVTYGACCVDDLSAKALDCGRGPLGVWV